MGPISCHTGVRSVVAWPQADHEATCFKTSYGLLLYAGKQFTAPQAINSLRLFPGVDDYAYHMV
eukprot:837657-Pyramimonas_sp.AAC.1